MSKFPPLSDNYNFPEFTLSLDYSSLTILLLALMDLPFQLLQRGVGSSPPYQSPDDHPVSADRNLLFKIFSNTVHVWGASRPPMYDMKIKNMKK
jgi:hypothetical protein